MKAHVHIQSYALFPSLAFVDGCLNRVLVNARHEITTVQMPVSLPHCYLNALLRTSLSMSNLARHAQY